MPNICHGLLILISQNKMGIHHFETILTPTPQKNVSLTIKLGILLVVYGANSKLNSKIYNLDRNSSHIDNV